MQLGLIGLGKMGGNMRDRVRAAGHEVVGFDPRLEVTDVESLQALADALDTPRVVWVMVPSGDPTRETVQKAVAALRHQFGGHAVHEVGPSGTPGQLAGPSSGTGATPPQPGSTAAHAGPNSGTGSTTDD